MGNPVYNVEAANLFCGSAPADSSASNHLTLTEFQLPSFEEQYSDHRAGGAPVAIEIDTVVARLECNFSLLGITPQVMALVHSWSAQNNIFTGYLVIRDRVSGNAIQGIANLTGRLGKATPQNYRRGDVMNTAYAIRSIVKYKLTVGGKSIYEWDFFNNTLIIGGVDQNADVNNLLGTGVSTVTSGVNVLG